MVSAAFPRPIPQGPEIARRREKVRESRFRCLRRSEGGLIRNNAVIFTSGEAERNIFSTTGSQFTGPNLEQARTVAIRLERLS